MEYNNYSSYNQYAAYPPPYQPYVPAPPDPKELKRRELRKTSNGLGFFILVYYLVMIVSATFLSLVIGLFGNVTTENKGIVGALLQIAYPLLSPLIAGLFYKILSRKRISDALPKSFVPITTLVPMVLLGMGVAMIANQLATIFDNNISLFSLHNNASIEAGSSSPLEMILSFVGIAVCPALAEEFAFRGIVMGVLRRYGDAFAIIASALMFGMMHGNTTQIIFAFTLGLIFGYIDCKANSIIPSVIVHFINNFYAILGDYLESAIPDKNLYMLIFTIIMGAFYLLGILAFIYFAKTDKDFFRISNSDKNQFEGSEMLALKDKMTAFLTNAGVIICLSIFAVEVILNLIPPDALRSLGVG